MNSVAEWVYNVANITGPQKIALVGRGCSFLVRRRGNHGFPGAMAGQNMGTKIINSAAVQVAAWYCFISDWCPDGIGDNNPAFKDKRHADSFQSPACVGCERTLRSRQESDAPRLDHPAHWSGNSDAIVYFAGNFYTVVYSGTYYVSEIH